VLFNIFGGITRCDEVARGLIEAFEQIRPDVPFVVRLDARTAASAASCSRRRSCPTFMARRRWTKLQRA